MVWPLVAGAISGGISLFAGHSKRKAEKERAREERRAIEKMNRQNIALTRDLNNEIRLRADAAARLPIIVQRHSATNSRVDVTQFLSDMKVAGVNKLTALRAGVMSDYVSSNSWDQTVTWNERAMEAALAGQFLPTIQAEISQTVPTSSGEVLGNALNTGFNTFMGEFTRQEQNQFQKELLASRLIAQAGLGRSGSGFSGRGSSLGGVPSIRLVGGGSASGGGAGTLSSDGAALATLLPGIFGPGGYKVGEDDTVQPVADEIDRILSGMADQGKAQQIRDGLAVLGPAVLYTAGAASALVQNIQKVSDGKKAVNDFFTDLVTGMSGGQVAPGPTVSPNVYPPYDPAMDYNPFGGSYQYPSLPMYRPSWRSIGAARQGRGAMSSGHH